jgi:hypothetical protein
MTPLPWPIAHVVGDYLLQDHLMAQHKTHSSFWCWVHCIFYMIPFLLCGLETWQLGLIMGQHFVQDRWRLANRWQVFFRQSTPEQWPVGPFVVDQAFHLVWITLVVWLGQA